MNTSHVKTAVRTGMLALCLAASTVFAADKGIKVGDTFPELSEFQLEGKLPESLKGKVVIVDFWASWCGPCKDSFPVMDELQSRYGKKGLVVLAVNLDEDRATMEDFLKKHPVAFTVVRDASKMLVGRASIKSMPTSFVLSPDGKVASIHKGFHGSDTQKQYEKEVESLIGTAVVSKE
jgi:cytochrome c biogenesis protein CcmG, thiol:disulfide interchange protein DsbE